MSDILIIINKLTTGGAERQVINDANLLATAGHQVTVLVGINGELSRLLFPEVELKVLGTEGIVRSFGEVIAFLAHHRFDVIYGHLYWSLKVAAIPAYFSRQKMVWFEHGLGLWRKFYHIFIVRVLQLFVLKVVVVSKEKERIKREREHTREHKLVRIPNSFQQHEWQDDVDGEEGEVVSIVFMGRFNPVKQLNLLPEIAQHLIEKGLRDFKFVLCGEGTEKSVLEKAIALNGLGDYFDLPGYIANPYAQLCLSDIFILPSRTEDFSVALLEAASARLPLVAFNVGGNSDIIDNEENGFLVEPFSTEDFAEMLARLIADKALRFRLGTKAQKKVLDAFTEQHRLKHLLALNAMIKVN